MKPVMMAKVRVPSKKKMEDRFENPGDGTNYRTQDPEEKADKATNQANGKAK